MRVLLYTSATLVGLVAILPVLGLLLPFCVMSLLVRLIRPVCAPRVLLWSDLIGFDALLGWKPKPNLDANCLESRDDVFHVRTDADGWPATATLQSSNLVVFGDSYAFGYGVDAADSFAAQTADLPLKAVGAPGYNLVQELLVMRQMAPLLTGKLVVWFIYFGNDLYDNLSPEMSGYRAPFVREAGESWEIVTNHLSSERWSVSSGRQCPSGFDWSRLFTDTFLSRRAFAACRWVIGRGRELCDQAGARLVVMTIPALARPKYLRSRPPGPLQSDYPDDKIGGICRDLGVQFVPLKRYLDSTHYKEFDDHWNAEGHRRVAQVLRDLYAAYLYDGTARECNVFVEERPRVTVTGMAAAR